MKLRRLQLIIITATTLLGTGSSLVSAPKDAATARIRKPRAGEEFEGAFLVEGRTSRVPSGFTVFLFSQQDEDRKKKGVNPGTWPHGPLKANRTFEHKIIGKKGHVWMYVVALPDERLEFIEAWRAKYKDHIERFGRVGAPGMEREALFKDAIILGEFDIIVRPGAN